MAGATDGYRAVFALPGLDHAYTDRIVILADRRDGKPLTEKEGPLRIVVADEKREARWFVRLFRLLFAEPVNKRTALVAEHRAMPGFASKMFCPRPRSQLKKIAQRFGAG